MADRADQHAELVRCRNCGRRASFHCEYHWPLCCNCADDRARREAIERAARHIDGADDA